MPMLMPPIPIIPIPIPIPIPCERTRTHSVSSGAAELGGASRPQRINRDQRRFGP